MKARFAYLKYPHQSLCEASIVLPYAHHNPLVNKRIVVPLYKSDFAIGAKDLIFRSPDAPNLRLLSMIPKVTVAIEHLILASQ